MIFEKFFMWEYLNHLVLEFHTQVLKSQKMSIIKPYLEDIINNKSSGTQFYWFKTGNIEQLYSIIFC